MLPHETTHNISTNKAILVMSNPSFLLVVVGSLTAFMALFLSAMLHRFVVPKHKDTFRQTLKFGLLAGLVGMVIFFAAWTFKKSETNSWETPGVIGIIPFYFMLAGISLGVYLLYYKKK